MSTFAVMSRQLVGTGELIHMLGVSRKRAYVISRHEAFPAPVAELMGGPIWELEDVQSWAAERGRTLRPLDDLAAAGD